MKKLAAAAAAALVLLVAPFARGETKTLSDLDDVRACTPLEGGGFAAATGGGLVVVGNDGAGKAMTALDGLPETRTHAVAAQGSALWVGTEAGAALVENGRVARTTLTAPVHAIHISPSGVVLFGTRGDGVYRLAARGKDPDRVPSVGTGTRVTAVAEKDGTIFAAYADGPVARLEGGALRPIVGAPAHAHALAAVGSDLVVGSLEGLFRVDARGATSIASVDARGIAVTDGGRSMLVATYGSGLVAGDARGALRAAGVVARHARGVGIRGEARCVATTEGLYVAADGGAFRKVPLGGVLPSNDVTAIAASGSRVAVGTFDAGAVLVERGVAKRIEAIARTETVNGLAWQGDRLWLATAHGLVRVGADGSTRRFTADDGLPSTFTRAIAVVSGDTILVGTEGGPAFVREDRVAPVVTVGKGAAVPLASPMRATWAVAVAADGTMWIGTAAGLYYGRGDRFARASVATGELQDDWVTALAVDGSDVFVGTYSQGVTRLRVAGGTLDAKHLGGGYVNPDGLVVDGGRLYAATMNHLLVRAKSDDSAPWEKKIDASPGRDVTAVRFVGSEMWVASRRGIAAKPR